MIPPRLRRGDPIGKLVDHWNMLIDHLNEIRIVAGGGISVSKMPAGTVISARGKSGGSTGSSAASFLAGPFAVSMLNTGSADSPSWQVVLYNSAAPESKIAGMLTIGSYREEIQKQFFDPQEGVLFLDATYDENSEKYTCSFALEENIPDTGDEKRYIYRIGEISYDDNTKNYKTSQIHPFGDIDVLGRWVK